MKCLWRTPAIILAGLLVSALHVIPQTYTISAKPGAVNYVEGQAALNGQALGDKGLRSVFMSANDTLSTELGKAEVLLTPGVFLRLGDNSAVRMISPSLTSTQFEVLRGEVIVEAAGLLKENNIQVVDHGASIVISKNGLYRISADQPPTAAVLEGKADVTFGQKRVELGKGRETILAEGLKSEKFDTKKEDDLYAWSNVRSQYDAASSYQASSQAANMSAGSGWYGYGYGGWYSPGWLWNSAFNSWAWLPGSGAFYSPFGWGFYSPGVVTYAPVVTGPVYRGGHWTNNPGNGTTTHNGPHDGHWNHHWTGTGTTATVGVNPHHPGAVGAVSGSPWANQAARSQAAQSFAAQGGFRTATGSPAAAFSGNRGSGWTGGGAHMNGAGGSGAHANSGGGAAHSAGGFSGGGGHAGGGSGGGHGK